jgi:hypothetical protein
MTACLDDNAGGDIAYVTAVRQLCKLADRPGRAVGFIERQMSERIVVETLRREQIGDRAYEREQRNWMRKYEGVI